MSAGDLMDLFLDWVKDDIILVKDRRGKVIGFERLNYLSRKNKERGMSIPVEVHIGEPAP